MSLSRLRLLLGVNLFWLALSLLNEGLTSLVLPSLLLALVDGSLKATALGLLTFVGLVVGMLVQPIAGQASDRQRARLGRRPLLALGAVGMLAGLLVLGASRALIGVLAAYTLVQVMGAIAQAAQQGFLPDLVEPAQRGLASGLKGLLDLGGAMLAFALLGWLLGAGRVSLALALLGAVVLATLIAVLLLVRDRPIDLGPEPSQSPRRTWLAAFHFDWSRHRAFAWLVASRFLFLLATYGVGRFFLYFVADRLGLPASTAAGQAGALLAIMTLAAALGAPLTGWAADRLGRLPLMLFGAGVSLVGALLLIRAAASIEILIDGLLMSIGSAAFASANWAQTADLAPSAQAGRFFGLANFGTAGAVAAAGLFGPLVDALNRSSANLGYVALFIVAAGLFALSALAAWRSARSLSLVILAAQADLAAPEPSSSRSTVS